VSAGGASSKIPTLFLTDYDVEQVGDISEAINAIRAAYQSETSDGRNPGRIFANSGREWLRIMPSIPGSGDYFGYKSISGVSLDSMRVTYLVSLFDKATGDLAALIDGNRVTGLRTAATTAVGAATITPLRPVSMGVIGSGFEARSHVIALSKVIDISHVRVFSPTPANRMRFADEVSREIGIQIEVTDSAEAAVSGAELILCAARSVDETPTIEAEWVSDNATVISIGSTTPGQRELPEELMRRATLIVADTLDEVLHGSGDMIESRKLGIDVDSKTISLASAVMGHTIDRESGIRIYKSTGAGLQDIVVAEMLVHRARKFGIGTELGVGIVTTRK